MSTFSEIINVYKTAIGEISRWEKIRDELGASIKDAMGDAGIALVDDVPTLRKQTITQHRFDAKLFREEFPELAEKYMIKGTYARLTVIREKTNGP